MFHIQDAEEAKHQAEIEMEIQQWDMIQMQLEKLNKSPRTKTSTNESHCKSPRTRTCNSFYESKDI